MKHHIKTDTFTITREEAQIINLPADRYYDIQEVDLLRNALVDRAEDAARQDIEAFEAARVAANEDLGHTGLSAEFEGVIALQGCFNRFKRGRKSHGGRLLGFNFMLTDSVEKKWLEKPGKAL